MDTKVLTILFSDIKGFTKLTSTTSRENLSNLLKQHENTLKPIIESFGGRVIKMIGDALLAVFDSPTNAVHCAIMMQITLREENEKKNPQFPIHIRIAINTGEVELKDGDVYGEAVNVASRLESITGTDEIYFTDSVFLSMNRNEVATEKIGYKQFKGIPHEVKIYRVVQNKESQKYNELVLKLRARKYNKITNDIKEQKNIDIRNRNKKRKNLIDSSKRNNSTILRNSLNLNVILIILLILITGAGTYFLFLRETPAKLFSKFQITLDEKNFDKAEILIDKLYHRYQNSPYTIKAVERLVDERIDELLNDKEFERANDLLRIMKNKYPFINRERWLKEILIGQANELYDSGDTKRASLIYQRLLMDYKDDQNILMEYNIRFKDPVNKEMDSLKDHNEKNDLEASPKEISNYDNDSKQNKDAKTNQINGFDKINKNNIGLFAFSEDKEERVKQLIELRKNNTLDELNIIRFYYYELIFLGLSNESRLKKAIDVIKKLSEREDWESLKEAAGIDIPIKDIKAIYYYDDISKNIALLVSEKFRINISDNIKSWLYQKNNNSLRLNSYYIYLNINESNIDVDFYKDNLISLDPNNNTRAFFDLVEISIDKVLEFIEKDPTRENLYKNWLSRNKRELENIRRKYQYDTKGIFKTEYINRLSSMINKVEREVEKR